MADGQDGLIDAETLHLAQEDFEDRHITDRQERFGQDFGIGGQAGAFASGEDHGFHGVIVYLSGGR